jgi:hypothetical protein
MPATTKKPPPTRTAEMITEEQRKLFDDAELMLYQVVRQRRDVHSLMPEESMVFRAVGWFEPSSAGGVPEVQLQLQRVRRILDLQKTAGTSADREAAKQALEETNERAKSELPTIEQQIRELAAQRDEIRRTQVTAERAVFDREKAVEQLTDPTNLPPLTRRRWESLHRQYKHTTAAAIGRLEAQRKTIAGRSSMSREQAETTWLNLIKPDDPIGGDLVGYESGSNEARKERMRVPAKEWDAFVAKCELRVAEIDAEIASIREEARPLLTEMEECRCTHLT